MTVLLDEKIKAYLAERHQALLELLETLCKIPAPSNHEEKRAAFVKEWLEKRGAAGVYIDAALNVVYPFQCENKNALCVLMAHTDTVFPDLEPFSVVRENGFMRCPGVSDDTANLALLLMTIEYILQNGLTSECGILFVANSGEEGLGNLKGIRQIMRDYSGRVAEVTAFDGSYREICSRAVGSKRYRVTLSTEGGHSYQNYGNKNAIFLLSALVHTLYALKVPARGKSTYNVGTISGGTSVNTIAQQANMLFEYRSDSQEDLNEMTAFFENVIEAYRALGAAITVELVGDRPCMGAVDAARQMALTAKAARAIKAAGAGDVPEVPGSTDCNIPQSLGIPAVAFGGHLGTGTHTREEALATDSLRAGFEIVAAHILSYCNRPQEK